MPTSKSTTQSAAERKAADAAVAKLVAKFSPGQEALVAAMRKWVRKRLPTAFEVVYEYKSWFVFSYSPSERGYEGVLAIRGDANGVKLYFQQGKGLPDPEKLLRGAAQTRWIGVESASTLAHPAVGKLADEAIARNKVPFASPAIVGRGPIVVRPPGAK
ncbi:MAG: hypothetical protein ABI639_15325 [Thermoanaerobaculia bacterium]